MVDFSRLYSNKEENRLVEIINQVIEVIPEEKRGIALEEMAITSKDGGDEIAFISDSFNHNVKLYSLFSREDIYGCPIDILFLSEILLNAEKAGWKYHRTIGEGKSIENEKNLIRKIITKNSIEESALKIAMSSKANPDIVNELNDSSYEISPVFYLNNPKKKNTSEFYIFTRFKNKTIEENKVILDRDLLLKKGKDEIISFEYDRAYSFLTENKERDLSKLFS